MLFHLKHVHTHENCFAHKPDVLKALGAHFKSAQEKGIHVHSLHVAPWEHTWYGIVEAESAEALEKFMDPLLELGKAKITPVTDVLATIEKRLKGEW
jgi:hypothetical protein